MYHMSTSSNNFKQVWKRDGKGRKERQRRLEDRLRARINVKVKELSVTEVHEIVACDRVVWERVVTEISCVKESSVTEVHERVASPVPKLPLCHTKVTSISPSAATPATQKAAAPQGHQARH